ncbi:MAG: hypothetical protein CMF48_04075 [Legionellales bacterium]|nr:hypothetical protein [Legionellales bacterium]
MKLKVIKRHLSFLIGFNKMLKGVHFSLTFPTIPIKYLFHLTEFGKDFFKLALFFIPRVLAGLILWPILLPLDAIFNHGKPSAFRRMLRDIALGTFPFILISPIVLFYGALHVLSFLTTNFISGVVWLGAQFAALFGGAPKTTYYNFFDQVKWKEAYQTELHREARQAQSVFEVPDDFAQTDRAIELSEKPAAEPGDLNKVSQHSSGGSFFTPSLASSSSIQARSEEPDDDMAAEITGLRRRHGCF